MLGLKIHCTHAGPQINVVMKRGGSRDGGSSTGRSEDECEGEDADAPLDGILHNYSIVRVDNACGLSVTFCTCLGICMYIRVAHSENGNKLYWNI